jgi:hypothetical protein
MFSWSDVVRCQFLRLENRTFKHLHRADCQRVQEEFLGNPVGTQPGEGAEGAKGKAGEDKGLGLSHLFSM